VSQFIKVRELFSAFGIKTVEFPGYEADDLIGSLVERFKGDADISFSILTGDLDLLQLVEGERIRVKFLKKGMRETDIYDEAAVIARYGLPPRALPDLKGLLGDQSDNIPGVSGIGPKTAAPLIAKYGTLENLLDHLWEIPDKIGMKIDAARETALFSKRLATIARGAPLATENVNDFILAPFDLGRVRVYFQSLGFKSLADRL
jgi:DNA polymerase-1